MKYGDALLTMPTFIWGRWGRDRARGRDNSSIKNMLHQILGVAKLCSGKDLKGFDNI